MVAGGTIAEELFDVIKLKNYCVYVNKLNDSDAMTAKEFHESQLSTEYSLDTRVCFTGKRINNAHMFEIFGEFSCTDSHTVRLDMI